MKKTSTYYNKIYTDIRKEFEDKTNLLRSEAEAILLKDIDLVNKVMKISGQKGWNVGLVTQVRLSHDFKPVAYIKGRPYLIDSLVEPTQEELKRYK